MAAVFWGANYAATQFAALCIPPIPIVAVESVLGVLTRHTDALYAYLNREVL